MKGNYHLHTALVVAVALCSGSMAFGSESQEHHGAASSGHDTSHSDFSYNYGELRYINMKVDEDHTELDGNGFEFEGSVGIGDKFLAYALYKDIGSNHGFDISEWAVGFGTHFSMAPGLDLVADLGYISETLSEEGHGSHDDEGYVLGAGLRKQVGERGEIAFAINYTDVNTAGSTTSYEFVGEMHVLPTLAIGVGINTSKEATASAS